MTDIHRTHKFKEYDIENRVEKFIEDYNRNKQ